MVVVESGVLVGLGVVAEVAAEVVAEVVEVVE